MEGLIAEADVHLQVIAHEIHRVAHTTATLGLINFRKGRIEKGNELYEEAVRLATTPADKSRIRQKWNLERGRAFLKVDPKKGTRFLLRASEEKLGEDGISQEARALLKGLAA